MSTPLHNNPNVPPVPGMTFLGSCESYDVYFIPHDETGLHAITIVYGVEDWQWESCLVEFIRRSISKGDRRYSEGPYAFGVAESAHLKPARVAR